MTTSHRINCCSIAFIEIKFQQKLCFNNQVQVITKVFKCHGVMFSELSNPAGMPRFLVCMVLYSVQEMSTVNDSIFHDWRIVTRGMNSVIHEPITGSVNFDVFI